MNCQKLLLLFVIGVLCVSMIGCASTKKVCLDDQTIAENIKDGLESASGPKGPFKIDIYVNKGEVTLDGRVPNTASKERSMEMAHVEESVKDVKSFLEVKQ